MPTQCPRCGNCHIGLLIFAPQGIMVILRNDWENELSEEDFDYWQRAWSRLTKLPNSRLRDFVAAANWV